MDFIGLILGYGMGALGFWMIVTRMIRIQELEKTIEGSAPA